MPIPKTGGETKGGRQVEYRSHFNFSIKWWFHPLWEPGDTAQATRVAKKCFLATIRALQKEVGAPYFGAQNCTAVCIRLLLRPCYSSTGAPAVPVGTSTTVPVPRTGLNLVHVLDYCTKFSTKFKIVLQSTGTQRILSDSTCTGSRACVVRMVVRMVVRACAAQSRAARARSVE